jgi:hypothetical protein
LTKNKEYFNNWWQVWLAKTCKSPLLLGFLGMIHIAIYSNLLIKGVRSQPQPKTDKSLIFKRLALYRAFIVYIGVDKR